MKGSRIVKKIISILLYILTAVLLVTAVFAVSMKASGRIPSIFGYSVFQVISPSMEPAIPTGSYILVREKDPQEVREGDVISFRSSDPQIYRQINTHRVVAIEEQDGKLRFTTRGDNNPIDDATAVSETDLIGVYQKNIPFLSGIGKLLKNPYIFFVIALVPALFLFISEILNVKKKMQELRMQTLVEEEKKRLTDEDAKKTGDSDS